MNSIQPKSANNLFPLTVAGTTLLLAATVQAQSTNKMYLDVRAGVALAQDTAIQASPYGNGGNLSFDTGLHVGLNLGYHVCRDFAVELETGYLWNSVNSINGNSPSSFGASADFYQIPVLGNIVYQPLHGAFVPYVSVGAGGVAAIFDSSNLPLFGPASTYSDMNFVFAYQVTAGFKYAVNRRIDLGLAYEFLSTAENKWSDNGVPFNTDGVQTHSVMATFTWKF